MLVTGLSDVWVVVGLDDELDVELDCTEKGQQVSKRCDRTSRGQVQDTGYTKFCMGRA